MTIELRADAFIVTDALLPDAFPADFLFGAATAAFQIEGAAHEDGRTDSIWDAFCRVPGAVVNADNGDVACDHYHRYAAGRRADAASSACRPTASRRRGRACSPTAARSNPKGLDFYSRLVDELLEAGIKPWLTLYHWDLPQALEEQGGWANRDTAYLFRDYAVHDARGARRPGRRRGPRSTSRGARRSSATWAARTRPGRQDVAAGLAAGHHLLLAHGLAVQALRERDPELELGITLNLTVAKPGRPDASGRRRRRAPHRRRSSTGSSSTRSSAGTTPATCSRMSGTSACDDVVQPGDLEVISTPIDTLGVNYYHGEYVSDRPAEQPLLAPGADRPPDALAVPGGRRRVQPPAAGSRSRRWSWEVQPDGLRELLVRVQRDYAASAGVRLYVTENGAAYDDVVAPDGAVHDAERAEFLEAHLGAILDAIDEGVAVHGYFYWSLMDNFEWAWGYDKRFGIVRVDYDTQERTVKDSGLGYAAIIRDRALPAR